MSEEELKAFRNLNTFSTKYIVNKKASKASSKNDITTMFVYIAKLEVELEHKDKEIERLKDLCNKYEEEHKTAFEEWKKAINIIKEVREKIESVQLFGLRSGKTLIATLLNDILKILDKENNNE